MRALAAALPRPDAMRASTECGSTEAAGRPAARFGVTVQVHPGLDLADGCCTDDLRLDRFQAAAEAFPAALLASHKGLEQAADTQARVGTA